jgi:hypothetical protein
MGRAFCTHCCELYTNFGQEARKKERERERLCGRFRQRLNANIKNDVEEIE